MKINTTYTWLTKKQVAEFFSGIESTDECTYKVIPMGEHSWIEVYDEDGVCLGCL